MERNAYTLVTLIEQINQQLPAGSQEKLVVIGPSMGGQIARYALTYMEHNNRPHNTRLYLSLDSPHNGATIPIGLQHFVQFFADRTKEKMLVDGLAELNSPAARQLVQHHHTQGTSFLPDPLRTSFMNTLNSMGGYPTQLRRIAVTNGSLDGILQRDQNGQTILAGQQAFGFEQRGVPNDGGIAGTTVRLLWPLGLLARTITTASARVNFAPGNAQTIQVLAAYHLPSRPAGSHYRQATGLNGSCGLDGSPGGFRYFFSFAKNHRGDPLEKRNFYSVRDKACFIPTLSGLGYNQAADNCQTAGQNLVCAGLTPFDAYYGPKGHNEDHIQLTLANVEFMRNEILQITPVPIFTAAPASICPGSNAQFSVREECARAGQPSTTYTWTSSDPAVQIISGQGTGTVSIAAPAGYTGEVVISVTARRQGYADSAPAQHSILIRPGFLSVATQQAPCEFEELTVDAISQNINPASLKWFIKRATSSTYTSYATGQTSITLSQTMMRRGTVGVRCEGLDICTNLPIQDTQLITVAPCGNRTATAPQQALFPNPADGYVDVTLPAELLEDPGATAPTTTTPVSYSVTIYDGRGKPVLERESIVGTPRLDVRALPSGLYHVQLRQGAQVYRRQLSIQH